MINVVRKVGILEGNTLFEMIWHCYPNYGTDALVDGPMAQDLDVCVNFPGRDPGAYSTWGEHLGKKGGGK